MSTGPQRLGKYELQKRLERGGMGEVWKAYDVQLKRYVAIKLLHANLQANPDFVSRFTREAQFIASLHHPNIVQVHDFQFTKTGESGSTAYMVMDYIEGGTLANYIRATSRKGQFPSAADIVYLFTAISHGLDYAHQRSMIHRDIKPANILLDKRNQTARSMGEPILTDFGIARWQGAAASTLTASLLGTPRYISPEQAQGLPGDERSDLYSLGIVLYEIVTGIAPFQGDNPMAIMLQHLYEMPAPPSLINPNIPQALSTVVLQSIAKDPEERFLSASAMTVALAQALNFPVPASLDKSSVISVELDHNPLQPTNQFPEGSSSSPHLLDSHPLSLTPPSGYVETSTIVPTNRASALVPPEGSLSSEQALPASTVSVQAPSLPASLPSSVPTSKKFRSRGVFIALIACLIIILVGTSIGTISLLTSRSQKGTTTTPKPPSTVVGQLVFVNNHGTFNQVRVNLQNIPSPPAGTTYYAWLDRFSGNEAIPPLHWPLCSDHGTVHCLYTGDSQHNNLLQQYNQFLISAEDVGTSPEIPYPTALHYYAQLSQNGPTTFEIRTCPSSSVSNASNPCR